jgi:hypothetical protein
MLVRLRLRLEFPQVPLQAGRGLGGTGVPYPASLTAAKSAGHPATPITLDRPAATST